VTAERSESSVVGDGRRLIGEAAARGLPVRLMGGVAFWLRGSDEARARFGRTYPDLDIVAHKRGSRTLRAVLEDLGYQPERTFNAVNGDKRLLYKSADLGYQIDVFLDVFTMCHQLNLGGRLEVEELTLPAAELLLTKLQIHELNQKDVSDVCMLLSDHELGSLDGPLQVNLGRVVELCAADWGLYTTVSDNLRMVESRVDGMASDPALEALITGRLRELRQAIEEAPKPLGWRARAAIGRRVKWYMLPEEVVR